MLLFFLRWKLAPPIKLSIRLSFVIYTLQRIRLCSYCTGQIFVLLQKLLQYSMNRSGCIDVCIALQKFLRFKTLHTVPVQSRSHLDPVVLANKRFHCNFCSNNSVKKRNVGTVSETCPTQDVPLSTAEQRSPAREKKLFPN